MLMVTSHSLGRGTRHPFPLRNQTETSPSLRFSGVLNEVKQNFEQIDKAHIESLLNLQAGKAQELSQKTIITINNRAMNGIEFLELVDQVSEAERKSARKWGAGIVTPLTLGLGTIITVVSGGWPALFVAPLVGNGLTYLIPELREKYIYLSSIKGLAHKSTPLDDDTVKKALSKLVDAGLLEKHDISGSYEYYVVAPLGVRVLEKRHSESLNSAISTTPNSLPLQEKTSASEVSPAQKKENTPSAPQHQRRLQLIKTLTSQNPHDGLSGYDLLEKVVKRYDERFPVGRLWSKGLTEAELMNRLAPADGEATRQQLKALCTLGLLTRVERANKKVEWRIDPSAREILKNGDPAKNGSVSSDDLSAILQLEIDQLEQSKKDKHSQFQTIEGQHQQLLTILNDLDQQINTLSEQQEQRLAQIDKETDEPAKRKLLRDAKIQQVHLDRQNNLKRIQTELAQRMQLEIEGKEILLGRWNEQVERNISDLMESQVKIKVLKTEQNITEVIQSIQEVQQKQIDGSRVFDQEAQWLHQHIQAQHQKTKEPASLTEQSLAIEVEKALEAQLLRSDTDNVLKALLEKEKTVPATGETQASSN